MKKLSARIAAFALSLVVALGSVCYNPPKAEAVVVESAAAMAGAFTYLSATGFEFAGDGTAYGAMADAFQMMFTDWTQQYDAYVNEVSGYPDVVAPTLQETILNGMTLLENGFVEFSAAAANALGRFEDWLIDKLGLIGADGVAVEGGVGFLFSELEGYSVYGNMVLPVLPSDCPLPYVAIVAYAGDLEDIRAYAFDGPAFYNSNDKWVQSDNNALRSYVFFNGEVWKSSTGFRVWNEVSQRKNNGLLIAWDESDIIWSNYDIMTDAGVLYFAGSDSAPAVDTENPVLSALLADDYEAAPTVDEQYAMVVNPGLTFEDEQSYIDAVMNGVVAGTLASAYTIESTTAGDVINPDVGTDTEEQANILSWLKHIVQDVRALPQAISDKFAAFPQAIANAIQGVFVPDAALTTEITDTFSEKFAFVPQLHQLGTDLLNLGPDSGPPVIYIHLEDAEGTIDYGGTVKALDMSWYERYKEDVDRIISGFLWLGFLWLCFMRASDIINGAGMVYAAGQPTIYTPDSPHDAPRLESPRWRRRG